MDCELARELLDAARSGARDRDDPALAEAFAHLDACPACTETKAFRDAFDRSVGALVRSVHVPADLKSRLLTTVAAGPPPDPRVAVSKSPVVAAPQRKQSRRAALLAASAAALLVAAGWSLYQSHSAPAPLASADVLDWWREQLARPGFDAAALPEFDRSFDFSVADGRWRRRADPAVHGADLDDDGTHDAAVFTFRGGFLVVLGPARVSDPPSARSANAGTPGYLPVPHVAWTSGESMHICFVPGATSNELQQLLRSINGSAA